MRKIINGKVYDTETAKSCGEWRNGYSGGDFNSIPEELFLKKTGEFFLHSQGGQMTEYAEWHGNMKTDVKKIKPLTYEEAREWAEEHLTAEEYENTFGEIEEDDDGQTPIHVYVKNNLTEEMGKEKRTKGLSFKDIVNDALAGYFNK